jgi:hypothetical protein
MGCGLPARCARRRRNRDEPRSPRRENRRKASRRLLCARVVQKPDPNRDKPVINRWRLIEPRSRTKNRNRTKPNRWHGPPGKPEIRAAHKSELQRREKPRERENECARTRILPRQAVGAPNNDRDGTKKLDSSGAHLPRPDAETGRQLSRYEEPDRREQDTASRCARKATEERQCGGKIFTAASGPPREADTRTARCWRRLSERENKSKHGGAEPSVNREETTATKVAAQPR